MVPEKWCLRVDDENLKEICDWRAYGPLYDGPGGYVMSHGKGYWQQDIEPGYEEITTQQFRTDVLKIKYTEYYEAY